MRKKTVAGRASSSSRIDLLRQQPLAADVDPAVVAVGLGVQHVLGVEQAASRRLRVTGTLSSSPDPLRRPSPPARSASTRWTQRARRSSETGFSR